MSAAAAHPGRIGPNAIIQVGRALPAHAGDALTGAVFHRAGLAHYLERPPESMVDEIEVRRLHAALRELLPETQARAVAREAGQRTGAYLLAHRIPKPVQSLLKRLPAPLAARALLSAIRGHAWTFVGSGRFSAEAGAPVLLHVKDNPLCRGMASDLPACDFYSATFERLFAELVHPRARVQEVSCEACGADECRFEIRW